MDTMLMVLEIIGCIGGWLFLLGLVFLGIMGYYSATYDQARRETADDCGVDVEVVVR